VGTSLAAESLLSLAVTVTSEQRVESVLQSIVQGLAAQPGMALARIWLLPSAGLPSFCRAVSSSLDDLSLVASAGTSINSPGEDWSFLQGHFARVPFNVGKVGQVAASRHPILVEDVAAQNDWIVRPEWVKREEIRSFAGHPLVFRDKLLGVIAVFSRQHLGQQEFTWLGLFANQAALAIANACAEEALQSSERNLSLMINAIPAIIGVMRADGTPIYGNQGVTDYNGLTMEDMLKEDFRTRIFHPEDMEKLHEERRLAFSRPVPFENELRALGKDGKHRWFLFRYKPLLDESGKIDRWYMAATDIEDRKKAKEALQSSERNLSLMSTSSQRLSPCWALMDPCCMRIKPHWITPVSAWKTCRKKTVALVFSIRRI
jgi:PAS domain S-box-containing protein